MPANRGLGSPNWSPQPDFPTHMEFQQTVDERVFKIYSEEDVTTCLLETDPQIDAYRWSMTEHEVRTLAFESAQTIVKQRKEFLLTRQLELARAARQSGKAVVAGTIENIETGEITSISAAIPMGRAFG
jgi:hypothetical protein